MDLTPFGIVLDIDISNDPSPVGSIPGSMPWSPPSHLCSSRLQTRTDLHLLEPGDFVWDCNCIGQPRKCLGGKKLQTAENTRRLHWNKRKNYWRKGYSAKKMEEWAIRSKISPQFTIQNTGKVTLHKPTMFRNVWNTMARRSRSGRFLWTWTRMYFNVRWSQANSTRLLLVMLRVAMARPITYHPKRDPATLAMSSPTNSPLTLHISLTFFNHQPTPPNIPPEIRV